MVVRVIPVGSGGVVGRDLILVIERLARHDMHEDVVAVVARRDVKTVDVQIRCFLVQAVDEGDFQVIPLAYAQGRARDGSLIRHSTRTRFRIWLRFQLDGQEAVFAGIHLRLPEIGAHTWRRAPDCGCIRARRVRARPDQPIHPEPDRAQAGGSEHSSTYS